MLIVLLLRKKRTYVNRKNPVIINEFSEEYPKAKEGTTGIRKDVFGLKRQTNRCQCKEKNG